MAPTAEALLLPEGARLLALIRCLRTGSTELARCIESSSRFVRSSLSWCGAPRSSWRRALRRSAAAPSQVHTRRSPGHQQGTTGRGAASRGLVRASGPRFPRTRRAGSSRFAARPAKSPEAPRPGSPALVMTSNSRPGPKEGTPRTTVDAGSGGRCRGSAAIRIRGARQTTPLGEWPAPRRSGCDHRGLARQVVLAFDTLARGRGGSSRRCRRTRASSSAASRSRTWIRSRLSPAIAVDEGIARGPLHGRDPHGDRGPPATLRARGHRPCPWCTSPWSRELPGRHAGLRPMTGSSVLAALVKDRKAASARSSRTCRDEGSSVRVDGEIIELGRAAARAVQASLHRGRVRLKPDAGDPGRLRRRGPGPRAGDGEVVAIAADGDRGLVDPARLPGDRERTAAARAAAVLIQLSPRCLRTCGGSASSALRRRPPS